MRRDYGEQRERRGEIRQGTELSRAHEDCAIGTSGNVSCRPAWRRQKDRVTPFLSSLREPLLRHLVQFRKQLERDLQTGGGYVYIPVALRTKYPNASRDWRWHWVFPATRQYRDEETGELRRHHLHATVVQKAVSEAVKTAGQTGQLSQLAASRLQPSCSKQVTTSGPSRSSSATPTSERR
jgi:hypothetical protein